MSELMTNIQPSREAVITGGTNSSKMIVAQSAERIASVLLGRKINVRRLVFVGVFCLLFAAIATFRKFGFDLEGEEGFRSLYPNVADGWGLWYWAAQLRLDFNLYLLLINLVLSAQISLLAFPSKFQSFSKLVSLTIVVYLVFWFLFGQSRYGMAITLLALAARTSSFPVLLIAAATSFFIHKAAAGGILLVIAWRLLRNRKHGLLIALIVSAIISSILYVEANSILLLTGYANYLSWTNLPASNTPLKFYYIIAVLGAWKYTAKTYSNDLLILTLLFLPFSYFIVFAGRSFEMFSVIFLSCLLTSHAPRYVRDLFVLLFIADVALLVFGSGFYL
jgi:hypothetical protein